MMMMSPDCWASAAKLRDDRQQRNSATVAPVVVRRANCESVATRRNRVSSCPDHRCAPIVSSASDAHQRGNGDGGGARPSKLVAARVIDTRSSGTQPARLVVVAVVVVPVSLTTVALYAAAAAADCRVPLILLACFCSRSCCRRRS